MVKRGIFFLLALAMPVLLGSSVETGQKINDVSETRARIYISSNFLKREEINLRPGEPQSRHFDFDPKRDGKDCLAIRINFAGKPGVSFRTEIFLYGDNEVPAETHDRQIPIGKSVVEGPKWTFYMKAQGRVQVSMQP
jgi:hypothetical protein